MLNRIVIAVLLGAAVTLTWQVQGWRHARQLAELAAAHAEERQRQSETFTRQRLALEQRLQATDQSHYQELHDAQQAQARLRDRLATADLRLSVLLDADSRTALAAVPATAGTPGLDHGPVRAGLDPAHAQRIVAITDAGDQGLIALLGCQAWVREQLR